MNITETLLDSIELEYHDEIWHQLVDYEHIPFHCKRCHEYGHLYRECPITITEQEKRGNNERRTTAKESGQEEETSEKFKEGKKQGITKCSQKNKKRSITIESQNKFKALQEEEIETEEKEDDEVEGMEFTKEPMTK